MNGAFPEAEVTDYEEIIPSLTLPDQGDNHVRQRSDEIPMLLSRSI
jgi:hypothetical protein